LNVPAPGVLFFRVADQCCHEAGACDAIRHQSSQAAPAEYSSWPAGQRLRIAAIPDYSPACLLVFKLAAAAGRTSAAIVAEVGGVFGTLTHPQLILF
jgi:hypothetical protein